MLLGDKGRKQNVVELAWAHVICPMARAADPLSWVLFVLFLASLILSVVGSSSASGWLADSYSNWYPLYWYGSWMLLVLSSVGPIFCLTRERLEVPLGVLIAVSIAHVAMFIGISVVLLSQDGNTTAITGLLAATAAACMVGIGWVVQHQSGARASRRAHTFTVLMQSRLSSEFQEQVRQRASCYAAGNPVSASDARLVSAVGLEAALSELAAKKATDLARARDEAKSEVESQYAATEAEVRRKYESLQGVKYLLNFYEFLSAGIYLRELDEPMLRETLRDIAIGLYEDTKQVRMAQRRVQPDVFRNLDRVVRDVWGAQAD